MASLTFAQELQDEFGSAYSQDFLEMPSVAETEAILPTCRNHYNAIDLYWMGPNGNVKFHLPPPLLFVGLRGGSYRGLLMAKYEVVGTQYGTDQANAQWAFKGQFQRNESGDSGTTGSNRASNALDTYAEPRLLCVESFSVGRQRGVH